MIYVTSDLHFNHANILKYEPESRPFATIEEMNETIISNWNSVVKSTDTVYVLGDLSMGQIENAIPLIKRLKGKIILIRGNHDTPKRMEQYRNLGIEIHDIFYLPYKGRYFVMCHFPIASQEFIDMVIKDNSEVVVLYGHVHHNAPTGYVDGTYHVGLDTNALTPLSIEKLYQECWTSNNLNDPSVRAYKEAHEQNPNLEI